MKQPRRIVVLGILGRTPVAGVAWQVMHYLSGLKRLGHEVYYVEDTEVWPYNPETGGADCDFTVNYIDRVMARCELSDHWAFCDVSQGGRVYGLSSLQLSEVYKNADALINLTGSTPLRDIHRSVPVRVYLETDPCVPQIEIAQGRKFTIDFLSAHSHHFSFGENLGTPDCPLPTEPFKYRATRQPVITDWWLPPNGPGSDPERAVAPFTTIATWKQSNNITWNGELYTWSKHDQFLKFLDVPSRSNQAFELALACDDSSAIDLLNSNGWRTLDALDLSKEIDPYRTYIAESRGEFTVAKDQNMRLKTGWFSDRSACYLAAGRPVVTQDTAFDKILPTGAGLFSFKTMDDVLTAMEAINSDYQRHSRTARAIAEEYFRAETVMGKIIQEIGL